MDVIVFRASLAGENKVNWGDGIETIELNLDKSKSYMDYTVKSIVSKVLRHKVWAGNYTILCCLSDKVNFRKSLYPAYKANRTKPKPQLYAQCRKYAEENYECRYTPTLEADDQIAILATSTELNIVCSIDKDFLTIPNTTVFNVDKETFTDTTEESAMRFHLYQCLLGDSVDNIKGCIGIGKVKANKILDQDCSWEAVVRAYQSKGQTEEEALLNARLVRILHASDYDADNGEVILWTPKASS